MTVTDDRDAPTGERRLGTFAALRIRNYRLYFVGQLVSMCGTWMQGTAMAAYVLYKLHGNGTDLGLLTTFTFLPVLVVGLWAGVVIDRVSKRSVLLTIQLWMGAIATVQTVLIATGRATMPSIYVLTFLAGFGNTFDQPARQTFTNELVPRPMLMNAVGLSSMLFHSGRVIGQALGGILVSLIGYSWCFGINAVSYLAIVIGFLMMRTDELHTIPPTPRSKGQLREGIAYIRATPVIRTVALIVFSLSTFSLHFQVVVPLLARDVFHGGPRTIGWFQAAVGVGAVLGSLLIARRRRPEPRQLADASAMLGVGISIVAFSSWEPLTVAALCLCGMSFMAFFMTANTTMQLTSDPQLRGRVMALYAFTFSASTPFGAPVIGWMSDQVGRRGAITFTAVCSFVTAAGAYRANAKGLMRHHLLQDTQEPA